ncbi:MAG: SpaA isopeptide-forming pilin-related protein [Candidatus Metalachnospira sp.]|nr:SpaA isopeptide-forming pilin-related protein [Candidatus Metalachnospira sp.]
MKKREGIKKKLAVFLSAVITLQAAIAAPLIALGEQDTAKMCENHLEHDKDCGFEAHMVVVSQCNHEHNDECGYIEGVSCECEPDENGEIIHTDGCGYVEGHECEHAHDENCGYLEKLVIDSPCTHSCELCEPQNNIVTMNSEGDRINGENQTKDVTELIMDKLSLTLTQDGAVIKDGKIDSTKGLEVKAAFSVPIQGDGDKEFVNKNDYAELFISDKFSVKNAETYTLKYEAQTIGTLTLKNENGNAVASILFGGDAFDDPGNMEINCTFEAELEFNKDGGGLDAGEHTISILGKEFTIVIPQPEETRTITKEGTEDLSKGVINWTVTVGHEGENSADLNGYSFYDDLTNVGEYVADSFKIGGTDATPGFNDSILTYGFQEGTQSPQVITFETKIPEDKLFTQYEQTVKNTAELRKGEEVVKSDEGKVNFTPKWIEKKGEAGNQGSDGTYDPTDRTITWTITANHYGYSLNDVIITDKLADKLEFVSAKLQRWNSSLKDGEGDWEADNSWSVSNYPENGELAIGDITTKILLTIVTKVPDPTLTRNATPETGVTTYYNSASIKWEGNAGFGTQPVGVGIGYNAIEKTGAVTDYKKAEITWNVKVDAKKQTIPDMKVYDLLVYSDSFDVDSLDESSAIGKDILKNVTPQYNQRIVKTGGGNAEAFNGEGLKHTVTTLYKGGKAVADLLTVTSDSGGGIGTDKAYSFSYKTQVTNTEILTYTESKGITNTAMLFSGSVRLNSATANVGYDAKMLQKGTMTAVSAEAFGKGEGAYGVDKANGTAGNNSNTFNYIDKSAVFRIYVNKNGLYYTTVTNADGELAGKVTVTDTLPDGWKFVPFESGANYYAYSGTTANGNTTANSVWDTNTNGAITAEISGGTAVFTFDALKDPCVILVKAVPDEATIKDYFNGNKETKDITNNVELTTEKWQTKSTAKTSFDIKSSALSKTFEKLNNNGVLKWTVDYNPYGVEHTDIDNIHLEDTLPIGLDLPIYSSGKLIYTDNINVYECGLNTDGTLTKGTALTETEVEQYVKYNNTTRVISFLFPKEGQAYELEYITEITGDPGQVTNSVKIVGMDNTGNKADKVFDISSSDASATIMRRGWIEITKTGDGGPLAGAEFTVFALDCKTVIRKGTTDADGKLTLRGLPDGEYILEETKAPDGYGALKKTYSVKVATTPEDGKITTSISRATGENSNKITITNHKTGTVGDLVIKKNVEGNAADADKKFRFTVTLSLPVGQTAPKEGYDYIGFGVLDGKIKSGETIELADGEYITIIGLPGGTEYSVVEDDYSGDGYMTSSVNPTGIIVVDNSITAEFTNTKNKKIEGGGGGGHQLAPKPPKPNGGNDEKSENPGNNGGTDNEHPDTPPVTNPEIPVFVPIDDVPDSNQPDSPNEIVVVDGSGKEEGSYTKTENPDGSYEYKDANGNSARNVPKTGDSMSLIMWSGLLSTAIVGIFTLLYSAASPVKKRRRS